MMSANINDYALMPLKTVEAALADFDCGREDIDDFFHNKAQAYEKAMFGKTYALCPNGDPDTIMGAITVANASIFTRHLSWRRRDFIGADIEARYPEDKEELARTLTPQACRQIIDETKQMQQWIEGHLPATRLSNSSADTSES